MKGLEVTFRGKTSSVAMCEYVLIDITIEKIYDSLRFSFGGRSDTDLSYVWDHADDLKIGDEIIIKQKEIEKSSDYLYVSNSEPKSPELIAAEVRKCKLDNFYILENKLKEAGLI
jgi:hypothetical protein